MQKTRIVSVKSDVALNSLPSYVKLAAELR